MSAKSAVAEPPRLLLIVGPTASGKSELALRLAEQHAGEIVSADSVQIYRHFDIGSGKPNAEELARVPHHLIDEVEPDAEMDAGLFAAVATEKVQDILDRGRLPIICGGTFLWVKALLYGLAPTPGKDAAIREEHQQFAAATGRAALHARLLAIDPESYARLMPNDLVRVSRALEVYQLTGKPLSQYQREHGFRAPRFRANLIGIAHPREQLHARILERIRGMLVRGWTDEVRTLLTRGYGETRPMQSVGYAQVRSALLSAEPFSPVQLAESAAQATRVFARRQMTWLREQPVHWIPAAEVAQFHLSDLSAP